MFKIIFANYKHFAGLFNKQILCLFNTHLIINIASSTINMYVLQF